jgi:ABC-2 type transport system ATP-binding protein
MIEIEGLHKSYGDFPALAGLDLRVRDGELYAFLGPNGAGKTTTIKILVGLIRPTSGVARIEGLDVVRDAVAVKRVIGFVPDTPWLYDRLTAWEFLRLIAGLHGMDAARFRRRAELLLESFSIASRSSGLIEDFSLGMRQKLCFAGAFLHEPRAVIIDEPWVGLDPRAVRDVVDFLKDRNREGCTVLMSTHSLAIAERIADRVGILHRGRLIAEGTVPELLRLREGAQLEDLFLTLTEGDAEAAAT